MVSERNLKIRKRLVELDDLCNQAFVEGKQTGNYSRFEYVCTWANPEKSKLIGELCGITSQGKNPLA